MKIDNIKEEETQDMENLRKKNKTEMQNKMEGQSNRLGPAEDRISELKDEMVIKGKAKELLVKQIKTCEKKMQELTDSIKRPNLRIMGTEGEEVQAKGMHNIINKIITENFPNLEKDIPIQMQEASRTPNRSDQNRTTPQHIIIKTRQKLGKEY
jgi:predicted nuclease with TOPRIM domain